MERLFFRSGDRCNLELVLDWGGLMATLNGVYSASVMDNRDPDGLGRVLVRMSASTDVVAGDIWARVRLCSATR
jgi:hypothetical protein